jgi:hypothetical protein
MSAANFLKSMFGGFSNQASQGQLARRSNNIETAAESDVSKMIPDHDFFQLEGFRPSSMNQERRGLINPPGGNKYLGNQDSLSASLQVENCADEINCALFIVKIHPAASLKDILSTVRTGAIFAVHITPAKPPEYPTQAAKLVFMKHDAAAEYLRQIRTTGIYIRNKRIEGVWNRHGYVIPPQGLRTRVLHIRGPAYRMDPEKWLAHMDNGISIDLEECRELPDPDPSKKTLEFRLARLDGQAESVTQMILKNPNMRAIIEVKYGPDPCDPESGFR